MIEPDSSPPPFLERLFGELSPDGPDHYPVVVAKLVKRRLEGPALTVGDLNRAVRCTLVLVGDDDQVRLRELWTAVALQRHAHEADLEPTVSPVVAAPGADFPAARATQMGCAARADGPFAYWRGTITSVELLG